MVEYQKILDACTTGHCALKDLKDDGDPVLQGREPRNVLSATNVLLKRAPTDPVALLYGHRRSDQPESNPRPELEPNPPPELDIVGQANTNNKRLNAPCQRSNRRRLGGHYNSKEDSRLRFTRWHLISKALTCSDRHMDAGGSLTWV